MGTVLSIFDTTPANAVADIKTKILLSSDWSNPAGSRIVCTTTRGADMVVDLADAAATAQQLQFGVYRTSALADKITRYVAWRTSGGATTNPIHVIVSAGKEHLFLAVEGPRAGEPSPVSSTAGSYTGIFFLGDIVPYFSNDTIATVACVANDTTTNVSFVSCYIGRNQANNASWVAAKLVSMERPHTVVSSSNNNFLNPPRGSVPENKTYLYPYFIFEDTAGLRGSLAKAFYTGMMLSPGSESTPLLYSKVVFDEVTYIMVPSVRRVSSSVSSSFGGLGSSDSVDGSIVVAIPA